MAVFGTSGKLRALHFTNLPPEDKKQIIDASARGLSGASPEALDLAKQTPLPSVETEKADPRKASSINLKFVAFRTPKELTRTVQLPSRLFFTLKFYMFPEARTERLLLRLPKAIANLDEQDELHREEAAKRRHQARKGMAVDMGAGLLLGRQYFLMRYKGDVDYKAHLATMSDNGRLRPGEIETDYIGLENGLECNFDFDPQAFVPKDEKDPATLHAMELQQHAHFCEYLADRAMTIDLWNGESGMHFGTCKVPLRLLMRQA